MSALAARPGLTVLPALADVVASDIWKTFACGVETTVRFAFGGLIAALRFVVKFSVPERRQYCRTPVPERCIVNPIDVRFSVNPIAGVTLI